LARGEDREPVDYELGGSVDRRQKDALASPHPQPTQEGSFVSLKAHLRSNSIAYVALFCSLSLGTAWAATELTRNSVRSKHIAAGQVKRNDLARNAVNSSRVANGSLKRADFAAGQLPQGPDTAAEVLAKLKQVDGSGSGLDADQIDGLDSSALPRVIHETTVAWDPPPLTPGICAQQGFALPLSVLGTDHLVVTLDAPDGSFPAGQVTGLLYDHTDTGYAILCNNGSGNIDQPPSSINALILR
jgi:hypothetical protein